MLHRQESSLLTKLRELEKHQIEENIDMEKVRETKQKRLLVGALI